MKSRCYSDTRAERVRYIFLMVLKLRKIKNLSVWEVQYQLTGISITEKMEDRNHYNSRKVHETEEHEYPDGKVIPNDV